MSRGRPCLSFSFGCAQVYETTCQPPETQAASGERPDGWLSQDGGNLWLPTLTLREELAPDEGVDTVYSWASLGLGFGVTQAAGSTEAHTASALSNALSNSTPASSAPSIASDVNSVLSIGSKPKDDCPFSIFWFAN